MIYPVPISDDAFHSALKVLEGMMVLSVKFKLALRSVLFETVFERDSRILQSGRVQDSIWLLVSGLARELRVDEQSFRERTTWFWLAADFMCTNPGFFSQDPSERTIEILERSKVVLISYLNWRKLMHDFPETELLTERIRRACDKARLVHAEEIKNLSTDERYLVRRKVLEDLFTRTKQKYVAEMMGMAPDTLGKLKSKYTVLK